jgi:hypothetical protein
MLNAQPAWLMTQVQAEALLGEDGMIALINITAHEIRRAPSLRRPRRRRAAADELIDGYSATYQLGDFRIGSKLPHGKQRKFVLARLGRDLSRIEKVSTA